MDHLPDVAPSAPDPYDIVAPDGIPIASRDLLVIFAEGTTVADANAIIVSIDAETSAAASTTRRVTRSRRRSSANGSRAASSPNPSAHLYRAGDPAAAEADPGTRTQSYRAYGEDDAAGIG